MAVFGLKNTKAQKLTQSDVQTIREMYERGTTQGALSREFQVSVGQIGRIVRGESRQAGLIAAPATRQELDDLARRLMQLQEQRGVEEVMAEPPTGLAKLQAVSAEHFKGDRMVGELGGETQARLARYLGKDDGK